jgi:hypothetical protein
MSREIVQKSDEEFTILFNANASSLLERKEHLDRKLKNYTQSRQRFANVTAKINALKQLE